MVKLLTSLTAGGMEPEMAQSFLSVPFGNQDSNSHCSSDLWCLVEFVAQGSG